MYALAYFGQVEGDGKSSDAMVVEAGDRDGEAPVFGMKYKVTKSGRVKTSEIEYFDEIESLWGNDETSIPR